MTLNNIFKLLSIGGFVYSLLPMLTPQPPHSLRQGKTPAPLGKRSVGLYNVTPWKTAGRNAYSDEHYDRVKDFDFVIRNVRYNDKTDDKKFASTLKDVDNELEAAQNFNPVKSMILRVDFWSGEERAKTPPQSSSVYAKRIDRVLSSINWKNASLIGVSLSEENVPQRGGRARVLRDLYEYVHQHYPGLPVYQWYTPNTSVPGTFEGVTVPADGWIIDPYTLSKEMYPDARYHLGSDPYLTVLKKYLDTGKPVIDVLWASDIRPQWFDPNHPENKNHINEWQIMEHQFQINQQYNVPSAFYWMAATGDSSRPDTPFFGLKGGPAMLQQINNKVLDLIQRAHS